MPPDARPQPTRRGDATGNADRHDRQRAVRSRCSGVRQADMNGGVHRNGDALRVRALTISRQPRHRAWSDGRRTLLRSHMPNPASCLNCLSESQAALRHMFSVDIDEIAREGMNGNKPAVKLFGTVACHIAGG